MIKITNRQGNRIFFAAVIIIIIWMIWSHSRRENDLRDNGIIVTGEILGIHSNLNSLPSFYYQFHYNNIEYTGDNSTGVNTSNYFIGKYFPVIFSPKTGNSELLMTPEDFSKYDMELPDKYRYILGLPK